MTNAPLTLASQVQNSQWDRVTILHPALLRSLALRQPIWWAVLELETLKAVGAVLWQAAWWAVPEAGTLGGQAPEEL